MNEVKFGFAAGYSLVFSAFAPDGVGRGIENQPLPEVRPKGFYHATPITELEVGDEVLAYILETVFWENDPLYILTEAYVYWEGERLYWEGEWLFSTDDIINDIVTWVGDPIGAGEFEGTAVDMSDISDKIDELIEGQSLVHLSIDEREPVSQEEVVISGG